MQHEPRSAQEDTKEEKFRQDQTIRRVQIQAEKDKTMADRTRHILDQRLHETSKLTINSSSVVSSDLPASPLASSAHLIQHHSSRAHAGGSTNQASTASNQQTSMSVSLPGSTSDSRALSCLQSLFSHNLNLLLQLPHIFRPLDKLLLLSCQCIHLQATAVMFPIWRAISTHPLSRCKLLTFDM